MKWYVVQAYVGFENKVKEELLDRAKKQNLDHAFGEILIPTESEKGETEAKNADGTPSKKSSKKPKAVLPGYIFVQMELNETTWHLVKSTQRVGGFIGGRHPSPVPDAEIQALTKGVDGAMKVRAKVQLDKGDQVRVLDKRFLNLTGTVEEVVASKQKVKVLLSIFGRPTSVELDPREVEKITA